MDEASSAERGALHIPDDLRYTCLHDGECCGARYDITVDPGAEEAIQNLDWRACSRLASGETPFHGPNKRTAGKTFLRTIDGACHFLNDERLCELHRRHGGEIKPLVCRLFPARFVRTPDGAVFTGLSFACKSVREHRGAPLKAFEPELRNLLAVAENVVDLDAPVRFEARLPMPWATYLEIEQALDEIFAREDRAVETCLIAGHVWLGMLRQVLHAALARAGATGGEREREAAESVFPEIVRQFAEGVRADGSERIFRIAERPAANPALKRMLLGSLLAFRNALTRRRPRLALTASVTAANLRHWARLGRLRLPPIEARISYRDFHPGCEAFAAPEAAAALRRYVRHALFRKDLVNGTDLFWGYGYLTLCAGLAQWYAAALEQADEADPFRALGFVEQYFKLHSTFNQGFLYHPALACTMQRIFRKPNFAHTILRG